MDADADDGGSSDLTIADTKTVSSATILTLETGGSGIIKFVGAATLSAGSGIVIKDAITSYGSAVMDADSATDGTATGGALTIETGKTLTSDDNVVITAYDIDLAGGIDSGSSATIRIHGSKVAQTIGLGGTSGQLTHTPAGSEKYCGVFPLHTAHSACGHPVIP